jgi:hypothetical protein
MAMPTPRSTGIPNLQLPLVAAPLRVRETEPEGRPADVRDLDPLADGHLRLLSDPGHRVLGSFEGFLRLAE